MSCEVAIDPGLHEVGLRLQDYRPQCVLLNGCLLFIPRWLTLTQFIYHRANALRRRGKEGEREKKPFRSKPKASLNDVHWLPLDVNENVYLHLISMYMGEGGRGGLCKPSDLCGIDLAP